MHRYHTSRRNSSREALEQQNESPDVLNLQLELRSAFPPWSTIDVSKSLANPVKVVVTRAQPKLKSYGWKGKRLPLDKTFVCLTVAS